MRTNAPATGHKTVLLIDFSDSDSDSGGDLSDQKNDQPPAPPAKIPIDAGIAEMSRGMATFMADEEPHPHRVAPVFDFTGEETTAINPRDSFPHQLDKRENTLIYETQQAAAPLPTHARVTPPTYSYFPSAPSSAQWASKIPRSAIKHQYSAPRNMDAREHAYGYTQGSNKAENPLRQEVDHLRQLLSSANDRAAQAERANVELEALLKAKSESSATGDGGSSDDTESLRKENKRLESELDEAHSHIFSLQPYRKDLTPEEAGRAYDDLVNGVNEWVIKFLEPAFEAPEIAEDSPAAAKKRYYDGQKLRKLAEKHGDLFHASQFPETDVDIAIAMVMRFLHDNIFQTTLIGFSQTFERFLDAVDISMNEHAEPKRDLYARRAWRTEAVAAVFDSPSYQKQREGISKHLTMELVDIFKIYIGSDAALEKKHCLPCLEGVVKPAIEFHEKLQTSIHHVYTDLNSYITWNSSQELAHDARGFFQNLQQLKCENLLQNRKDFGVAKLNPQPSRQELLEGLGYVMTVVPALCMRKVGKGDAMKETTVVRAEHVLVMWGTSEKRKKFIANGERSIMHRIFTSRDKPERSYENLLGPLKHFPWA